MIRIKCTLIIVMIIILNIFSMTAFATGESRDDPFIDTTDKTNFPSVPDVGTVEINKTAKWTENSNEYAQIKLDINAVPWTTGADVVLVLDTSSSMSMYASKCVNPEHYVDFTYTKPFTYQVSVVLGGGSWVNVTSDLTISGRAHIGDNNASGLVESYYTSGLLTEYAGQPITYYRAIANPLSSFAASDKNSQNSATTKRFFCLAFGGDTITGGSKMLTFPLAAYWYTLGTPYHTDQNHEYTDSYDIGCFFRIDVAKKAAKSFVDIMLDNSNSLGNRVSMLTFSRNVTLFDNGNFFTGSDTDTAKLKSEIDNITIPENQGTSYGIALNAARDVINSRPESETHRPAYVLFVSDGEPEYIENLSVADETKEDVKNAINNLNKVSSGTYAVGIGLTTENELREIKAVVKEPGININVSSDASQLQETFERIAHLTMQKYEKTIVTDIIADEFELVPHSEKYPWIVTIDGIETDISNVRSKDNLLTWTFDKIPSNVSLTFYIKLKPNVAPGIYDANKSANIIYVNYLGNWCKQTFPIPRLNVLSSNNGVPQTGENAIHNYLVYLMIACSCILIINLKTKKV